MATVIHCPTCRSPLAIEPHMVGQLVACPGCRQPIQLAAAPPTEPPQRSAAAVAPQSRQIASPPARPTSATDKPARNSSARRRHYSPAAVASWAVLAVLIVVAAVLIWRLQATRPNRQLAEQPPPAVAANAAPRPSRPEEQRPSTAATEPAAVPSDLPPPPAASGPASPRPPAAAGPAAVGFPPQNAPPSIPAVSPSAATPNGSASVAAPSTTAPSGDALAGLPAAIRLPSLLSPAPDKVLTLAAEPSEPLSIALRSSAADIPATAAYFTEPADDGRAWTVRYVSDLDTAADNTVVGSFRLAGRDLSFGWSSPLPAADMCRQFGNCLAELRCGNALHAVQLREPQSQERLVLDLQEDTQVMELPLADPPRDDSVLLEIRELIGFSNSPRFRNEVSSLQVGKEAVIEFADLPGAEISLRLLRTTGEAPLQLRVQSVFRENAARKFDLSLTQLDRSKDAAEKGLARAKRELAADEATLKRLQSDLSRAQKNRPTNINQLAVWQRLVTGLTSDISKCSRRIGSSKRQIGEHEARLAAEPKIRSFLSVLHKRASMHYALVAKCGDGQIVLIDGNGVAGAE